MMEITNYFALFYYIKLMLVRHVLKVIIEKIRPKEVTGERYTLNSQCSRICYK